MNKLELYLYIALTVLPWLVGMFVAFLPSSTPQQVASSIALPFLAWIVLSAYYLVRWILKRVHSHSAATKHT